MYDSSEMFVRPPAPREKIAHHMPGEVFPWTTCCRLTALDEAILAVPAAILGENESIGSVIHCDEGVRLLLPKAPHPTPDERILIWLQRGQSAWLSRSCQAMVVPRSPADTAPPRFRLTEVKQRDEPGAMSGDMR